MKGVALTLGEGDVGQLGLGPDVMERVKPALVPELPENTIQICAGGMHTICLSADGEVSSSIYLFIFFGSFEEM